MSMSVGVSPSVPSQHHVRHGSKGTGDFDSSASAAVAPPPGGPPPLPSAVGQPISPNAFAALLGAQEQSGSDAAGVSSGSFSALDRDGDGKVSKAEFEAGLGKSGADAGKAAELFDKLDADHDGSVGKQEMAAAHRHHGGGKGAADVAANGLNTSPSQSVTNLDGSVTTTTTTPDGSVTTTTSPAAGG